MTAVLLLASPALSQTLSLVGSGTPDCATPASRAARLDQAATYLGRLLPGVDEVPAAAKAEIEAALNALSREGGLEGRYEAFLALPFQPAWEMRTAVEGMKLKLRQTAEETDARLTIVGVSHAFVMLADLLASLQRYVDFDRTRTPQRYDADGIEPTRMIFAVTLAKLMECSARALPAEGAEPGP